MTNLAIKFLVSTFTLVSMLTEFVSNEKKLLIKKVVFLFTMVRKCRYFTVVASE